MTTTLTIRKALTLKNRLAKTLKELQERIAGNNVTSEGQDSAYNVYELSKTLSETMLKLIELKAAIQTSNVSIYPYLCEMEEWKSHISFRRSIPIDTREFQMISQGYGKDSIKSPIICRIKTVENDAAIADAERRIEALQDLVDQHNATTKIEVSFSN